MDISFSKMHLVGGVLAGGTIVAIALAKPLAIQSIANPFTTLPQFFPNIAPGLSRGAEEQGSRGAGLFVGTQRDAIAISILAQSIKTKSIAKRQKEMPQSPRRKIPGGGT